MNTNEPTPGPWRTGDREPYVKVWGPMRMNTHPILASMESEPRAANARLMAAAPDLLAALKAAVPYLRKDTAAMVRGAINAALKKAAA